MAVTSQLQPGPTGSDIWISAWQPAGLIKPSAIKPLFVTFEQHLLLRLLGCLSIDDQATLKQAIASIPG